MLLSVEGSINIIKLKVKSWFEVSSSFFKITRESANKAAFLHTRKFKGIETNKARTIRLSDSFVFIIFHQVFDIKHVSNNKKATFHMSKSSQDFM